MKTALELGLLEIIANKGPITASELVTKLNTDNPLAADMVERMLCLLATFSVVSCFVEAAKGKVFEMTAVGRYFVNDEDGASMGPLLRLKQDKVYLEGWYKQKDAVLEGGVPFNKARRMNGFEYLKTDAKFNHVFNEAMFSYTTIVMKKILQSYKGFEDVGRLVDVGGGLGHNLKIIMAKYSTIKGINFDLPHVTKHGISYKGLEQISGDMFESVPSSDVIFMKWILHDWDDENCLKILKNCYKALPSNGKVVIVEFIMTEQPEETLAAQIVCQKDIVMMTHAPGGRERTKKEYLDLIKAVGFVKIKFETCVFGLWIMEAYK